MAVHQPYGTFWIQGRWSKKKREVFISPILTQDPSDHPTAATSTPEGSHLGISHDSAHAAFNHTPSIFFPLSVQTDICLPRHNLFEASLTA